MKKLLLLLLPLLLLSACGEKQSIISDQTNTKEETVTVSVKPDDYKFINFYPYYCDKSMFANQGCSHGGVSFLNVKAEESVAPYDKSPNYEPTTTSRTLTNFHYTGFEEVGEGYRALDSSEWLTQEEFQRQYIPFTKAHEKMDFLCSDYGFGKKVIKRDVDVLMTMSGEIDSYIIQDYKGDAHLLSDTCQRVLEYRSY